ncbi:MAG: hypothetical protein E7L04_01055 [Anaerococcus sp.]|uniref:hypothetical protein n=1 Tax=Anaerococcus sp. TaxID=1872515 RepID=UPI00290F4D45|nr:hypothetical protein [Anaerococcus sp.]MDU5230041.1 hypothetical protein [Anaerococcus sp.]MDU7411065.1 hypothetical protein [Anaerococcus sp.]
MNRLIYYLMVFLFSVGVSVGITNSIIDFMFVITSLVVYMITLYLYKTVDQKLVIKFYNLIAAIFIIVEGFLLWEYRLNINKKTVLIAIIIFILILSSHKLIIKNQ